MPQLVETLSAAWPPAEWADVHVLVAVSGGPDSMALLRALRELKHRCGGAGEIVALHVNHQIHAAADSDEAWLVRQLRDLEVPYELRRVDTRREADRQGDGLEAAARALRYDVLQAAAEALGARFVATAHTADDQVETVLHRVIRGTGIEGLSGIPRQRALGRMTVLVRPLLDATRQEVLAYLAARGQAYREDPTNRDASFTRNRIRRDLLPLLRSQYNPRTDEAILRLARQAEELNCLVQVQAAALLEEAVGISDVRIDLDAARLRQEPEPLRRAVLRGAWRLAGWPEQQMSDAAWRRLSDLFHADSTRIDLPGGVEAEVGGQVVRLFRPRA